MSPLTLDEATLGRLPPEAVSFIKWQMDWTRTARPKQLPPAVDPATGKPWLEYGVMSGRGFGKTLTGAQWIARATYEDPHGYPAAVICPTLSDVKKVAFQGPVGLMNVIPPDLVVDYNKSDFIITMRNIAGGTTTISGFTAEKPESLRGPNHGRAWCFIAGTPVLMADGSERAIESVQAGDRVATRFGPRRVLAAGRSGNSSSRVEIEFGATRLTCTSDHPILTTRGWVEAGELREGDELWSACGTREHRGGSVPTDISRIAVSVSCFIDDFTRIISGLSRTVTTSTTETTIPRTTSSPIWNSCRTAGMDGTITRGERQRPSRSRRSASGSGDSLPSFLFRRWSAFSAALHSSARDFLRRVRFAALSALSTGATLRSLVSSVLAPSAASSFAPAGLSSASARRGAMDAISAFGRRLTVLRGPARSVASFSSRSAITPDSARGFVLSKVPVRKIAGRSGPLEPVYDLTVEDVHEFVAGGVVVHNCDEIASWQYDEETWDMLEFTLRLGEAPQILWTSTPQPRDLIRRLTEPRPGRIIVEGSTYENRENLAPTYLEKVLRFEGTRLGDQEIHGKLLNLEDGGVIKRSWFRLWPHDKPLPAFEWIVVSLDTAFTEKTLARANDPATDTMKGDPDATACTVWGVFRHEKRANVLLLDCWEDHLGLPELIRRTRREMATAYGDDGDRPAIRPLIGPDHSADFGRKPDILLIEDKGSGISLRQMLEREGIVAFPYNPGRADKLTRLHVVSPVFARRMVWLPESNHPDRKGKPRNWCEPMIAQLCSFTGPRSIRHDDFVDSTTQAMRFLIDKRMLDATVETRAQREERRADEEDRNAREALRRLGGGRNPYDC